MKKEKKINYFVYEIELWIFQGYFVVAVNPFHRLQQIENKNQN